MRTTSCLLLIAVLSGCASLEQPRLWTRADARWILHRDKISEYRDWALQGRIAIKSEKDAFSAKLFWQQNGERYSIRLVAPLGQGSYAIIGDASRVTLQTADNQIRSAENPESLLYESLGWKMPLKGLSYWVRGLLDPSLETDHLSFDAEGRLAEAEQSGWQLQISRYQRYEDAELPRKLSMENSQLSVRLFVQNWELPTK